MNPADLLEPALAAVWEAARCCERIAEEFGEHDHHLKDDASPVTIADYAAQAIILHRLHQLTPNIGVLAEEKSADLAEHPAMRKRILEFLRPFEPSITAESLPEWLDHGAHQGPQTDAFWTLDPVDGTKGFLRGGQYAIALALIENGEPVLGILGCPRSNHLDSDQTGAVFFGGDTVDAGMLLSESADPRAVRVCDQLDSSKARLCESVESAHSDHTLSAKLIDTLGISKDTLRIDSQAKYAAVARGDAALYLRLPVKKSYQEKIWDHAAGAAVIQAAGGKVTDLDGKKLDFSRGATLSENRGILASNGALHHATLAALQSLMPTKK